MISTKERLPDFAAVDAMIESTLQGDLPNFLSTTEMRRQEVLSSRLYALLSLLLFSAIVGALYMVQGDYGDTVTKLLIGSLMLWLTVTLLYGRQWFMGGHALAREMNMALVPMLSGTFNQAILYTNDKAHREETLNLLTESKLLTERDMTVVADDIYTLYGDNEVSVRELHATKVVQSGKNRHTIELFKGVFVIATLKKNFTGQTYISTEGDQSGFAHRDFWTAALGLTDVKETQLEWNDFENDLHVAATNPVEAREILTPDFMIDLHTWWTEHKTNIRIAFAGNKFYMLLPDTNIRISSSTTSTKLTEIKKYALSVARPLWRTLLLIEDIR